MKKVISTILTSVVASSMVFSMVPAANASALEHQTSLVEALWVLFRSKYERI